MGGRALFKAYFHITMASLIPLALMARMESLEMDSRILERVILAKVAIGMVDRQKHGRTMWRITSPGRFQRPPFPEPEATQAGR